MMMVTMMSMRLLPGRHCSSRKLLPLLPTQRTLIATSLLSESHAAYQSPKQQQCGRNRSRGHRQPPEQQRSSSSPQQYPSKPSSRHRKNVAKRSKSQHRLPRISASSSSSSLPLVNPQDEWILHPDLSESLRTCHTKYSTGDCIRHGKYTGFSLCCLGTGAGKSTLGRSNAATALRVASTTFLFDAGEGVQTQLMAARGVNLSNIRKIMITHMHGDHVFGLTSLLLGMEFQAKVAVAKNDRHKLVQVYGPIGLYNFIAANLSLSYSVLKNLTVEVYEFHETKNEGVGVHGQARRSKPFQHRPGALTIFPEFVIPNLVRKALPQNEDGTWTVVIGDEVKTVQDAISAGNNRQPHIVAAKLEHVPKLQCFGFLIQEPMTQPCKIDPQRATALGLRPGKNYDALRFGMPVLADNGQDWIQPEDVLIGERPKPRSVAILGDCCHVPQPMADLCRGVDVLVHESTHTSRDVGKKVVFGGHSTALGAGQFADNVAAKVLLLNHLSASASERADEVVFVNEAESAIRHGRTRVQMSYDFLEIMIPKGGFNW